MKAEQLDTIFPCVNIAPFGFPVVPLVKQMTAMSSGRGGTGRRWLAFPIAYAKEKHINKVTVD